MLNLTTGMVGKKSLCSLIMIDIKPKLLIKLREKYNTFLIDYLYPETHQQCVLLHRTAIQLFEWGYEDYVVIWGG